jgi:1-acyl-sn-glycerol-3-phosphate acyltransferase
VKRILGRIYLRAFGWKHTGPLPEIDHCVVIAAPHTSNWDGAHMIAISWALGLKLNWMGKHTLFKPPFGWFVKKLGGVPIDRRSPQGLVEQMADAFRARDRLWLAVPPEGTRGKVEHWKSGFYAIAHEAKVPVMLGFLDFENKIGGLGPAVEITGDPRADMDQIRGFYGKMKGRHPELQGPIRLRAEDENVWPPGSSAPKAVDDLPAGDDLEAPAEQAIEASASSQAPTKAAS